MIIQSQVNWRDVGSTTYAIPLTTELI